MVRGIERRAIFLDDLDRTDLVDRLSEVVPECGARFLAWAFMSNHIHYVVRTGQDSISRVMRRINTGFAVRFNLRHGRVGYLFQNRFRSRLVADDADLQGLVRYVHLNPVHAGVVGLSELAGWRWCGHGALMGERSALAFEDPDAVLSLFDASAATARDRLQRWMQEGLEPDVAESLRSSPAGGSESATPTPAHRASSPGGPALESLVTNVCRYYGASPARLAGGLRDDRTSRARAIICHVAVVRLRVPAVDVARRLGVTSGAISRALTRAGRLDPREVARFIDPGGAS